MPVHMTQFPYTTEAWQALARNPPSRPRRRHRLPHRRERTTRLMGRSGVAGSTVTLRRRFACLRSASLAGGVHCLVETSELVGVLQAGCVHALAATVIHYGVVRCDDQGDLPVVCLQTGDACHTTPLVFPQCTAEGPRWYRAPQPGAAPSTRKNRSALRQCCCGRGGRSGPGASARGRAAG